MRSDDRVGGGGVFFFFSSRRRHTRLTCDWSSDVCSSDLGQEPALDGARVAQEPPEDERREHEGVLRRSEEHTSELQSHVNLVCRLLLEKKKAFGCRSRSDESLPRRGRPH